MQVLPHKQPILVLVAGHLLWCAGGGPASEIPGGLDGLSDDVAGVPVGEGQFRVDDLAGACCMMCSNGQAARRPAQVYRLGF